MTGVFAVGNVINAKTARSQFIGGMTMGLSAWRCTRRAW